VSDPRHPLREKVLRVACVLALAALPLMVWSVFDPTVWPVLVALSFGQIVGTLSFALYLGVVARDLQVKRRLRGSMPPSGPTLPSESGPSSLF
jgi:hypothetical protein